MTFNEVHRLIKNGDIRSLRQELAGGLNPNLSNQFCWTLLMLAALERNTGIGKLLISTGADLDRVNDFGETALSLAAHTGHVPFIRILLTNGASTDCKPHGQRLEDSLRVSSALSQNKISSIMELINSHANRSKT